MSQIWSSVTIYNVSSCRSIYDAKYMTKQHFVTDFILWRFSNDLWRIIGVMDWSISYSVCHPITTYPNPMGGQTGGDADLYPAVIGWSVVVLRVVCCSACSLTQGILGSFVGSKYLLGNHSAILIQHVYVILQRWVWCVFVCEHQYRWYLIFSHPYRWR